MPRNMDTHAWLCPAVSLPLAIALFVVFGMTWWHALLAGLVIGCAIAVAWALVFGRVEGLHDRRGRRQG